MSSSKWRLLLLVPLLGLVALFVLMFAQRPGPASANPLGAIAGIAGGEDQTCALTTSGGVKCWGGNSGGDLGNGSFASSSIPVDVSGLSSGVTAVVAGGAHSCALTTSGGVKCWGVNTSGQLGVSGGNMATPVDVTGLTSGVRAITAGYEFTCAITDASGLKCWGDNTEGQTGGGSPDVVGLTSGVLSADAGYRHACAVRTDGTVKCWGRNDYGQLGNGNTTDQPNPVSVNGISNAVTVAAGLEHTCALTKSGAVVCWGFGYGLAPTPVSGLSSGVATISSFYGHSCALTTSGAMKCWGDNIFGQLGDGMACGSTCSTPVAVTGLSSGISAITTGIFHTCAVTAVETADCWGNNGSGQLGTGITGGSLSTPADVVVANPKPTPTATPCPTQGCATPTPTPTGGPHTGLDFSIGVNAHGQEICSSRVAGQPKCILPLGSTFMVQVNLDGLPANLRAYAGFDAYVDFSGVSSNNLATIVWPSCSFPATNYSVGEVAFGCGIFAGLQSTSYTGPLGVVSMTCSQDGTVSLREGNGGSDLIDSSLVPYFATGQDALIINCVAPQPYPIDTDGDGCPDANEIGLNPLTGGLRNFVNPWDYFNPTHDGQNRVDDVLAVVRRYGLISTNLGYSTADDRTYVGPNSWNLGPPDGRISMVDILAIIHQYGNECH